MATTLLANLIEAQTKNSVLSGDDLLHAARGVREILLQTRLLGLAADQAGERILGASLLLGDGPRLADRSRRFDGDGVLLVAGFITGDAALVGRAKTARTLGALTVHVALISMWQTPIHGCETIWQIRQPQRPTIRVAV